MTSGDTLSPGGGTSADAINNNCLVCHSADMVLNQPLLPKETWEAEVRKMIDIYKAPVDEADVASIVDYLAKTKGKKSVAGISYRSCLGTRGPRSTERWPVATAFSRCHQATKISNCPIMGTGTKRDDVPARLFSKQLKRIAGEGSF